MLERAAGGRWASQWLAGVVAAIGAGNAVLWVAERDGEAVGVLVTVFQAWPLPLLYVLAMATRPRTGFAWGPAFFPHLLDMAKAAGALGVRAEVNDLANERRLRRMGFRPEFQTMVAPCAA